MIGRLRTMAPIVLCVIAGAAIAWFVVDHFVQRAREARQRFEETARAADRPDFELSLGGRRNVFATREPWARAETPPAMQNFCWKLRLEGIGPNTPLWAGEYHDARSGHLCLDPALGFQWLRSVRGEEVPVFEGPGRVRENEEGVILEDERVAVGRQRVALLVPIQFGYQALSSRRSNRSGLRRIDSTGPGRASRR
jgi:hypothetical protein